MVEQWVPPAEPVNDLVGVGVHHGTAPRPGEIGRQVTRRRAAVVKAAVHGQHLGLLLIELGVGITVASVMVTIFLNFADRPSKLK